MSAVRVVNAGMLTTIQDHGRWGLQSHGVPVSGPMDPLSHRVANTLVGNDSGAAALEVTLLGPQLEFDDERVVAVTGAEFDIVLDGKPMPLNAPFIVSSESRLAFGARRRGARAYVAIAGGIQVPPTLGSRSTHVISRMGGVDGRALRPGDRLPLGNPPRAQRTGPALADPIVPLPESGGAVIRVLAGPQRDYFAGEALDALQSGPYTIAPNSDRMGFRLIGPALRHACTADIISDPTPLGVLQVPASGQPILLMADRQTSGGYPKIATVITADIGAAGQLGPGDTITFRVSTRAEAVAALIAQEQALMALERA
jgi:antagonist of KipI